MRVERRGPLGDIESADAKQCAKYWVRTADAIAAKMEDEGNETMRQWAGRVAAAMGLLVPGLATGCAGFFVYPGSLTGGTGTTGTGDYVYVANAPVNSTTGSLAGFEVGTGTLTAATGSPYALTFVPTAVAVNTGNTRVFVAGTYLGNGYINSYSIGTGGVLSLLASNNVGAAGETAIDVSPDGNWLVGLDSNGPLASEAIIDEYQISSTGQLTPGTGAIYTYTGTSIPTIVPRAIKFAPNGAYVFVAVGTAGDLVYQFATSDGALSNPLTLTLGSGSTSSDNALAVNSTSTYLYIARSGTNGGLAVFTIGVGGALGEVGVPLAAGGQPFSVVANKAGTDLYVADQLNSGAIYGYSVGGNGAVASLSPANFATVSAPRALAVDNSGNYLLAIANGGSPDLSLYSYSSTTIGALTTSIATGTDPTGPIAIATTH